MTPDRRCCFRPGRGALTGPQAGGLWGLIDRRYLPGTGKNGLCDNRFVGRNFNRARGTDPDPAGWAGRNFQSEPAVGSEIQPSRARWPRVCARSKYNTFDPDDPLPPPPPRQPDTPVDPDPPPIP